MENEELSEEEEIQLIYNYAQDLKKKEIDVVTRGKLINRYIKKRKLTPYAAMQELDIPKTTFYTWLRAWELGRTNYNDLLKKNWKPSDIQRALKNGSANALLQKKERERIDIIIEEAISNLSEFIHKKNYSIETAQKIRELQNVLNRILMRAEK